MTQQMLTSLSLDPLSFLNPTCTSGSSQFTYCWSLAWTILSISVLACEKRVIVQEFEYSLTLLFFGIGLITDIFQSCGLCWAFQISWHIECNTLIASSFRIWSISAGIPSPPLCLFIVMLLKAHLTSHFLMSALGEWSHHHSYLGH